ncbi:unnamed protein product [Rotaria socialis]|uniref:Uncharacterized protein n=1 Tax=Rotaria socialis TaxID=392032 RepID=A0A818DA70_9BILA|nr:unnamed protein product [Rotaria socialis]CAF3439669.1 unnamed protein product [Rotaria socialis]
MLIFSEINLDSNNTVANNSSLSNTLENIENSTIANTSTNSTIETVVKPLLVSHTASKPEMNAAVASLRSIVNQMNSYRHNDILFRIKHCDSNMKLSDICETYTVDNTTNLLIRQSNIDFQTLQHVSNVLVDRIVVQKLSQLCLSTDSYLTNLSESNIRITHDIVRERGNSFCSLQQCHSRLQIFVETCPTLSNKNVSITTLELLPMLCALHNEQIWSSAQCTKAIVYLLHIVYAFWAQVEQCHNNISNGFDGCTPECQTLDNVLNKVKTQCVGDGSFLSQVPALGLYQSINLKEICRHNNIFRRPQFIYSVEKFFSSNLFWNQFHGKPIYTVLFMIVIVLSVFSFSLCFYFMLKNRFKSNKRRLGNDNYEYTRFHDSSFELGANTEISNASAASNSTMTSNEIEFGANDRFDSFEYHRLLREES